MSLRSRLAKPPIAIGHMVFEFATPGIGMLAANAGADFLVLDLEHSGFTFETAKRVVLSARAAPLPLVVRVPSHDAKDLARACDIGADGVMVPLVSSADEARAIVAAVKYPPTGTRGVGQIQMHDRYRAGAFVDKARAANDALAVILQIESAAGVDAAAGDRGGAGRRLPVGGSHGPVVFARQSRAVRHPCVQGRHVERGRRDPSAGIRAGRLARNADECAALATEGFDCLALATDTLHYQTALRAGITDCASPWDAAR